ncbi:MAG: metallophosphoesterase family protein [Anaerolineae bacterium]
MSHSQRRLDNALTQASVVDFDDHSRLVFFSDLHRGDNGPADASRCNQAIFVDALGHYERQGFTYVEVGDGDELWKNGSLAKVQAAHRPVYRIMERLKSAGRLLVLVGNHQLVRHGCRLATAGPEAVEAILLRHRDRAVRFLVTHGHQADGLHARIYGLTRLVVRHLWRHLQNHGLPTALPAPDEGQYESGAARGAIAWSLHNQAGIEQRIAAWLRQIGNPAIICGHTHRPAFAAAGALPYFNTGSGVRPGYVTGLEIADGSISLVSWTNRPKEGPGAQSLESVTVRRVVLEGPLPLDSF